jgi:hypothetical protein
MFNLTLLISSRFLVYIERELCLPPTKGSVQNLFFVSIQQDEYATFDIPFAERCSSSLLRYYSVS